jgi:dipeptidyl aminopeptidase/acylaminoacyl peptidase
MTSILSVRQRVLALGFLSLSAAASVAAETRVLRPEDHLSLQGVSDPQLSPDGRKVAYVVGTVEGKSKRRSAIWIASTDGSTAPRPFTGGPQNASAPRWSPDGRTLAFVSARPAGDDANKAADKAQLHLLPIEGGEARRLTSLEDGVRSCVWSPDGSKLACLARVPAPKDDLGFERSDSRRYTSMFYKYDGAGWDDGRRTHVFIVDAASGDAKQITSGEWNDSDPDWSPDGTRLAFVSDRETRGSDWDGRNADVYVVPVTGGDPVKISDHPEADTQPVWSPDGQTIAFYGSLSEGDHPKIYLAPPTGGVPSRLASPAMDYLSGGLRWADGGRALTFEAGSKGERHLFRLSLDSKQIAPVTRGPRTVSQVDVNEKAGLMAYRAEDTTHPNDLFVSDLRGANERRLTRLNDDFLKGAALPDLERVAWKAADGLEIEGYLMRPVGFDAAKKYPMVVWVHGGPNGMHGRQWFFDADVLAGHGYAVFLPNPRGSSGYGEAFQRAVQNEWGGKAYTDLMGGVDAALKANPWIDASRLGIIGHSYGGFMTNWVVTQTPRFKAAVTVAGPSNMVSIQGQRDAAFNHRRDFGGDVFQNYQKYWDYSPVRFASQVKTPVLILHGEADHRVPLAQGEEWFRALRRFGVPAELVIFPRGNHGFRTTGEPKQVVEALNMQLAWLDRYLRVP